VEKSLLFTLLIMIVIFSMISCQKYGKNETGFRQFIAEYEAKVEPLAKDYNQADWDAYITGKKEYFDKSTALSLKIDEIYQNSEDFKYIQSLKDKDVIKTPELVRQLDILYSAFLSKQINPALNKEIKELAAKVENTFANFRTEIEGRVTSDNEVVAILKEEKDSAKRENVWRSQKKLGKLVADDIVKLVHLRNEAARELGFKTYFEMAMTMSEFDADEIVAVFEELDQMTAEPFKRVVAEIEQVFSKRYGIKKKDIRPWHYEDLFCQYAPAIYEVNLDDFYKPVDIPALSAKYYDSFGMPVEDILERSDLYEKEGKSQHAFSFWIDRGDDIRILCNIVPNERWMSTMLHELGHAVYDKYIDRELPFLLRSPAHSFTTEGIAMLMDRNATNINWMNRSLDISKKNQKKVAEITQKSSVLSKLIFARWSMVVLNFEKNLYLNPDQDLNTLWWDLVEKYQYVKRPDSPEGSEWATKIHIATYPVYYQNYQMGELFASQVLAYMADYFYKGKDYNQATFWDNKEAGDYLKSKIFTPGKKYPWNNMIEQATGEKLTAKHFAKLYVN